MDARPRADHPV